MLNTKFHQLLALRPWLFPAHSTLICVYYLSGWLSIHLAVEGSKPSLHCGNKEWFLWLLYSAFSFSLSGSIRLLRALRSGTGPLGRPSEGDGAISTQHRPSSRALHCFPHHSLFKRLCRQGDFEELDEGRQDQIKPLAHWCGPQQVMRDHSQGG